MAAGVLLALALVGCKSSEPAKPSGTSSAAGSSVATSAATGTTGGTRAPATSTSRAVPATSAKGTSTSVQSAELSDDDRVVCDALGRVAKLDAESKQLMTTAGFEDYKQFLADNLAEIEAAYAEAAAAASGSLQEAITSLGEATVQLTRLMIDAKSTDDFSKITDENKDIIDTVRQASIDVEGFTTSACGFSMNNR